MEPKAHHGGTECTENFREKASVPGNVKRITNPLYDRRNAIPRYNHNNRRMK